MALADTVALVRKNTAGQWADVTYVVGNPGTRANTHEITSAAFLTCSWTQSAPCRVYEATLSDLDHPQVVNAPIDAAESASFGAYSSDGERISYLVSGMFKQDLRVTTRATMGTSATLAVCRLS
jgi:hypothetical protein